MKSYIYIFCAICIMSCRFDNNISKPSVKVKNIISENDKKPKTIDTNFTEQDSLIYKEEEIKRIPPCSELMSVVRNSNWRYDRRRNVYMVNTNVARFHSNIVLANLKCKEMSTTKIIEIFGKPTKSMGVYHNTNKSYFQYHVTMDSITENTYDSSIIGIDITYANDNGGVIIELVTHDIK